MKQLEVSYTGMLANAQPDPFDSHLLSAELRISLRRSPAIVFQNVQQLTQEFKRLEGKQYTSSDEAVIDLVNDIGNL